MWFREHRAHIRTGEETAKTSSQWKDVIKGDKRWQKVRSQLETVATKVFDETTM